MNLTLEQIKQEFRLETLGEGVVKGMTGIDYPEKDHIILLESLSNPKDRPGLKKALKEGNCFLVSESEKKFVFDFKDDRDKSFVFSKQLKWDFIKLLDHFDPYRKLPLVRSLPTNGSKEFEMFLQENDFREIMIGPNCVGGDNLKIGPGSCLSAGVFLGHEVTIGRRVMIHPNVVIHHGSVIQDDCIIHAGTVIGSDGFGYHQKGREQIKIPQIGRVVVGRGVEIGANCTIDRATINATVIGERVKIDNLVQIAHNVEIGNDCVIVAQVGIAGSSILHDSVVLGGQVGIADHVILGEGVQVGAQSGIMPRKKIPPHTVYFGSPAIPYRESMKREIMLRKLASSDRLKDA